MPKRTDDFTSWQLAKLSDPRLAVRYLSAVLEESPERFMAALGNVARAHHISSIAEQAGTARETLYRSLSEEGNPGWKMLSAVMKALKVKFNGIEQVNTNISVAPAGSSELQAASFKRRKKSPKSKHLYLNAIGQGSLSFMSEQIAVRQDSIGTAAETTARASAKTPISWYAPTRPAEQSADWLSINPMIANASNVETGAALAQAR